MEANWIDIFCISALVILTALGAFFGLAKTIIHLIAWIGGAVGVFYAPEFLEPFLSENLSLSETGLILSARILGFLLPFAVLRLAGHFLNKFVKRHLSVPNTLGGALLGLLKGLVPCLLLLSTLYILPLSGKLAAERSRSKSYAAYVKALRKTGIEATVSDQIQKAKESIEEHVSNQAEKALDGAKTKAIEAAKESAAKAIEELPIGK